MTFNDIGFVDCLHHAPNITTEDIILHYITLNWKETHDIWGNTKGTHES